MNNTLYDVDFTRALPDPLKNDDKMLALGKAIAGELQENIRLARLTIIYPRIDELDEDILDILARDLHVDWYEDTHPVAAKRQVIKDSVKVHKRLGTKFAVVTALGSVFPHTEVQEWYEYGGTHHRFRIILDMTNANAPADFHEILRAVHFYKRLTAHLDEIIYQMSAIIEISVETTAYRYRQGMTGIYNAGEKPYRFTGGAVAGAVVEVEPSGGGYVHQPRKTGTKPQRSTTAALREHDILADTETQAHKKGFGVTGKYSAGEKPHRETGGGVASGGVEIRAEGDSYNHSAPPAGTKPERNINFINHDNDVFTDTAAEAFLYAVNMTAQTAAGTKPGRVTIGGEKAGALHPVITVDTFVYRVRRCGTTVTKNN
jgi:phage tail P2-like protein